MFPGGARFGGSDCRGSVSWVLAATTWEVGGHSPAWSTSRWRAFVFVNARDSDGIGGVKWPEVRPGPPGGGLPGAPPMNRAWLSSGAATMSWRDCAKRVVDHLRGAALKTSTAPLWVGPGDLPLPA